MRFLIFLPFFTYGGAEKQAAILAYRLLELGHEIEAWAFPAPRGHAPLRAEMESKGIGCRELAASPRLAWRGISEGSILARFNLRRLQWQLQLVRFALQIPNGQFDVVVPFTFGPSLVAALFRKKLGAPIVVWNHRGGYDDAGVDYSPFLVEQIRKAKPVFVANSSAGGLFLRDKFMLGPSSVHVISNVFVQESSDVPMPVNLFCSGECQLVQVANFFPQKDFKTLLGAMRLLKESGVNCHLHLAGSFPREDQERGFFEDLHEMGLSNIVTHHGRLDRAGVRTLLERAHIGILSTKSEGCPNSVMEYMHLGLPVIGTNIPGIRDLVGEVGAPYLFCAGDAMQLKTLIERLAGDSSLRTKLGQANRQRLIEVFNPEAVFSHWQRIFSCGSSGCRVEEAAK